MKYVKGRTNLIGFGNGDLNINNQTAPNINNKFGIFIPYSTGTLKFEKHFNIKCHNGGCPS